MHGRLLRLGGGRTGCLSHGHCAHRRGAGGDEASAAHPPPGAIVIGGGTLPIGRHIVLPSALRHAVGLVPASAFCNHIIDVGFVPADF
jgi:hypothetical protein